MSPFSQARELKIWTLPINTQEEYCWVSQSPRPLAPGRWFTALYTLPAGTCVSVINLKGYKQKGILGRPYCVSTAYGWRLAANFPLAIRGKQGPRENEVQDNLPVTLHWHPNASHRDTQSPWTFLSIASHESNINFLLNRKITSISNNTSLYTHTLVRTHGSQGICTVSVCLTNLRKACADTAGLFPQKRRQKDNKYFQFLKE